MTHLQKYIQFVLKDVGLCALALEIKFNPGRWLAFSAVLQGAYTASQAIAFFFSFFIFLSFCLFFLYFSLGSLLWLQMVSLFLFKTVKNKAYLCPFLWLHAKVAFVATAQVAQFPLLPGFLNGHSRLTCYLQLSIVSLLISNPLRGEDVDDEQSLLLLLLPFVTQFRNLSEI